MLSQSVLKQAIANVSSNISTDADQTTRRNSMLDAWADAFDAYGSQVSNVNLDLPIAPPNKAGFRSALTFSGTTAAQLAQEFGAAWTAYWTGLSFVPGAPSVINASTECPNIGGLLLFSTITTSTVVVVNSAPLVAALLSHFSTYHSSDPDEAADTLATIFHSNTAVVASVAVLTVGLDTTPTPAGPLPITNTCRLF